MNVNDIVKYFVFGYSIGNILGLIVVLLYLKFSK